MWRGTSLSPLHRLLLLPVSDRKSTRLNSSHSSISYAVFCLKKKKNTLIPPLPITTNPDYTPTLPPQVHPPLNCLSPPSLPTPCRAPPSTPTRTPSTSSSCLH